MSRIPGRSVLAAACVLAVAVPSVAVGAGEGRSFVLGERNPGGGAELSRESEVIADNGAYGTRQSNKDEGGGAIYGCRSNPGAEPCIRSNNLRDGRAFEFVTGGREVGRIESTDPAAAPLTTNAGGVATGFNADAVDGPGGASLAAAGDFKFARRHLRPRRHPLLGDRLPARRRERRQAGRLGRAARRRGAADRLLRPGRPDAVLRAGDLLRPGVGPARPSRSLHSVMQSVTRPR